MRNPHVAQLIHTLRSMETLGGNTHILALRVGPNQGTALETHRPEAALQADNLKSGNGKCDTNAFVGTAAANIRFAGQYEAQTNSHTDDPGWFGTPHARRVPNRVSEGV